MSLTDDDVRTALDRASDHLTSPPGLVDAVRRGGQRRIVRRRAFVAAAAIVAVGGGSGAVVVAGLGGQQLPDDLAGLARACTVHMLAVPPGELAELQLRGADPTGRYVVGTTVERGEVRGVLWTGGNPTLLHNAGAARWRITNPTDVNESGLVVGFAQEQNGSTFAWTYRDGSFVKLPDAKGYEDYGPRTNVVVNKRGDVAATAGAGPDHVGVVWPADAPDRPRVLTGPGGVSVTAIADDGTVLGEVRAQEPAMTGKPYVWSPGGDVRALTVPDGWNAGAPVAIRDGAIIGYLTRGHDILRNPVAHPGTSAAEVAPVRWPNGAAGAEVGAAVQGNFVTSADSGWLAVRDMRETEQDSESVLISPNGRARHLQAGQIAFYQVTWTSEDGRTVVGTALHPSKDELPDLRPATWSC